MAHFVLSMAHVIQVILTHFTRCTRSCRACQADLALEFGGPQPTKTDGDRLQRRNLRLLRILTRQYGSALCLPGLIPLELR